MSLRESILANPWQKIISLVLAVLLWFAIEPNVPEKPKPILPNLGLRQQERGDYRLPITVMNSAANTRAFKVIPDQVDVVVSGNADRIKELDPNTIRVFVDVSTITTNTVIPVEVSPPADITFKQVIPEQVTVTPLTVDTNSIPTESTP